MEEKNIYRKRLADELIELQLEAAGVVLVERAKWCGKTTTAMRHSQTMVFMNDPRKAEIYTQLAKSSIGMLLKGETPVLIDEWQVAPQFWNACRFEVDRRNSEGQFILTGSAEPVDQKLLHHTGTGRVG